MLFQTICLDLLLKLRYVKSIVRLYIKQDALRDRIGQYILKWLEWVFAGIGVKAAFKSPCKRMYPCPDMMIFLNQFYLSLLVMPTRPAPKSQ